jgi:hypothetical protein
MKRTTPKLEAEWRAHFAKFRRSKLTVVAYCRQAGISQSVFYRRRAELEPNWRQWKRARHTAPKQTDGRGRRAPFVPVAVVPTTTTEIELPSGVRIHTPATDRQTLATVIMAALDAQEQHP